MFWQAALGTADGYAAARAAREALSSQAKKKSVLRSYLIQPLLGAIWKQPLRPHHALDLEPDWMLYRDDREEEAPLQGGRRSRSGAVRPRQPWSG